MQLKPAYWWLCLIWLIIAVPTLYYGIPYGGGRLEIRFDGFLDFIGGAVAAAIMLFPLIGLPFFLRRKP